MAFDTLKTLPKISAYLRRIGAEPRNFKVASIMESDGGYPKEVGSVRFHKGAGEITFYGSAPHPEAEELEEMVEELKNANFPKPQKLDSLPDLPEGLKLKSDSVFKFTDFDGKIVMLQQRIEKEDGKFYVPWTRWSDNEWRMMEPDDGLPFYNLEATKNNSTLFIHEGPKAARRITRMIEGKVDVGDFPWFEEMRWGAHIGWVGGVHSLARSDWASLGSKGWTKVVIVADNDYLGRTVVPEIASHFRCSTHAIVLNDQWPLGFDLDDQFPEKMFSSGDGEIRQYIGPTYGQCLQPVTYGTYEYQYVNDAGKVKTGHALRESFDQEWKWVVEQDCVINLAMNRGTRPIPSVQFDSMMRAFCKVPSITKLMQASFDGFIDTVTYDPSTLNKKTILSDGRVAANLYRPSPAKSIEGDCSIFEEFIEQLIPDKTDRGHVLRWIATLIAIPSTRMKWGLLLMSEAQGTGKTTLGALVSRAIGQHNSSFPSENAITNSDFNDWIAEKRLVVVNEIYSGHSWKAYNRLKTYVSDEFITVNIKFEKAYTIPNWSHYMLFSNDKGALKIDQQDRRWLVPTVTEEIWPTEKFDELYNWSQNGGICHLIAWAEKYVADPENRVREGEIAPLTTAKTALVEESMSDAEWFLSDLFDGLMDREAPACIPINHILTWLENSTNDKVYITTQRLSKIASEKGLFVTNRMKVGHRNMKIVVNKRAMLDKKWSDLKAAGIACSDIIPDEF